jgi:tetraacyldisaccharide 4'-kinase
MVNPLSSIYARLSDLRNARFDDGRSKSYELGARTISVGNITTGGTGKTPLVISIAENLAARGERVCILTRGYGRSRPKKRVVVSDGTHILANARSGGDEPVEMARALLGKAVVIADRDRVAAGARAKERYGVTAFVLDDGFQHRRVRRDLDIVCIDGMDPFGGGRVLPLGRLRETLFQLKRATAVMITRSDLALNIEEIRSELRNHNERCPIFTARTVLSRLTPIADFLNFEVDVVGPELNETARLSPAYAFCALGNPEAFFGQLAREKFEVAGTHRYRDHFVYTQRNAAELTESALRAGARCLLTTAKDAVKLKGLKFEVPCFVVEARIAVDNEAEFFALL